MTVEALVIGGGLAGAALATRLALAGRAVTLVERESHPHDKVCGEFISPEAARYLAGLGIGLPGLGAIAIGRVRVARRHIVGEARLPFTGWSLSRRVLDEALLARAHEGGATILRGDPVGALSRSGAGWRAEMGERVLEAGSVFLATGKHDLRGYKRPRGWHDDLVGFKMHYRLAPAARAALAGHVELILFLGGYAGLEPIEDGLANLCLLIRRDRLQAVNGAWDGVLHNLVRASAHLGARLRGADALWPRPLAISAIPYGLVRSQSPDGLWRLGDQAAVIPSFAGDGMAMALHSAHRAASEYLAGGTAAAYQSRFARDVRGQVLLATALSRLLVEGWGQAALGLAARMPGLLPLTARHTRIPEAALAPDAS